MYNISYIMILSPNLNVSFIFVFLRIFTRVYLNKTDDMLGSKILYAPSKCFLSDWILIKLYYMTVWAAFISLWKESLNRAHLLQSQCAGVSVVTDQCTCPQMPHWYRQHKNHHRACSQYRFPGPSGSDLLGLRLCP